MKKLIPLLAALLLVLPLAACHDDDHHHDSPTDPGDEVPWVEGTYSGSALYRGGDPGYQEIWVSLDIDIDQHGRDLSGKWTRELPDGQRAAYRIDGEIREGGVVMTLRPENPAEQIFYEVTAGFEEGSGSVRDRLAGYGEVPGCVGCYSFTFVADRNH